MKLPKLALAFLLLCGALSIKAQTPKTSIFRDSLDNAIDISNWLLNKKGLLIIPTVITEPAVGYGAAAAAIYFHGSYSKLNGPPDMTGVLGAKTENGTWAGGVFHAGFWNHDRIRYMGAAVRLSANLAFYGSGTLPGVEDKSMMLNLDGWLFLQQAKFRVAKSNFFLGGRYIYFNTVNSFDEPVDWQEFQGSEFESTLSELSAVFNYDSRNNIFTPQKGLFAQVLTTTSKTWMGADNNYERLGTTLIGYLPSSNNLTLGVRQETMFAFGDIPFYARPMVNMRGVPVVKYQNNNIWLMEMELNWNLYKRWSLIGFTGMGNAFKDFDSYDNGKSVSTLGTGFRYLMARKLGAQMGIDFAKSNEDFGIYIVFGTAWLR
jgi:hypothetical protein